MDDPRNKVSNIDPLIATIPKPLSIGEYLMMELPKPLYLIGDWCVEGMPILISAPAKCGKSLFAYTLMHHLSIGLPVFDWPTPAKGVPVAIVDGEMRRHTIQDRLARLADSTDGEIGDLKIVDREILCAGKLSFPDFKKLDEVRRLLDKIGPVKAIVLDNVNCLFPSGDENSPLFWHPIEAFLLECKQRGAAAFLIHHNPKSRPDSPAGSSKAERIPEVVIILQRIEDRPGRKAHFNLKFHIMRDLSDSAVNFSARLETSSSGKLLWVKEPYQDLSVPYAGDSRSDARNLRQAGLSVRAISAQLNVPKSTIHEWVSGMSELSESEQPDTDLHWKNG